MFEDHRDFLGLELIRIENSVDAPNFDVIHSFLDTLHVILVKLSHFLHSFSIALCQLLLKIIYKISNYLHNTINITVKQMKDNVAVDLSFSGWTSFSLDSWFFRPTFSIINFKIWSSLESTWILNLLICSRRIWIVCVESSIFQTC